MNKTYIHFKTENEILERQNFKPISDISEEKIANQSYEIIGFYRFKEQVTCGIKSCRTKHNNGFLVRFENGSETLVGKICGEKKFGIDFVSMINNVSEYERREQYKSNIRKLLNSYKPHVSKMRTSLLEACDKITPLREQVKSNDELLSFIHRLTKNGGAIQNTKALSDEELRKRGIEEKNFPTYRIELTIVAVFKHADLILNFKNIRIAEIGKLNVIVAELTKAESCEIETLSTTELRKLSKLSDDLNQLSKYIASLLNKTNELLSESNIRKIQALKETDDYARFSSPAKVALNQLWKISA